MINGTITKFVTIIIIEQEQLDTNVPKGVFERTVVIGEAILRTEKGVTINKITQNNRNVKHIFLSDDSVS